MNFTEQAVLFSCAGDQLLGIVAMPEQPGKTGVVIVVGGPQYRVGSHRQFLLLSRALAAAGYPVMRFDHSGMGDSAGTLENFEASDGNICAAIGAIQHECPSVTEVVLWGLCDAASASLLYLNANCEDRVSGLVLLNPWVREESTLARAHIKHYYAQRLLQVDFWRKVVAGKFGLWKAIGGFLDSLRKARQNHERISIDETLSFQEKMLRGMEGFSGEVLLILSESDYTAKEFLEVVRTNPAWSDTLRKSRVTRREISGADHTFSSALWRKEVEALTINWLGCLRKNS
jgi:exosortase A-associated hydrolase 1